MRYPVPLFEMQHQYRLPIKKIRFHAGSSKIFTADAKIVKIYEQQTGALFSNIEPKHDVNDVALCANSGLVLIAQEDTKIGSYFLPSLGPAPKWVTFLENLTEEMEEAKATSSYEDFKFVTENELQQYCVYLLYRFFLFVGFLARAPLETRRMASLVPQTCFAVEH